MDADTIPVPQDVAWGQVPTLFASRRIEPVSGIDELFALLGQLFEGGGDALDQERALDGVLRLGKARLDVDQRKALKSVVRGAKQRLAKDDYLGPLLPALGKAWGVFDGAVGEVTNTPLVYHDPSPPDAQQHGSLAFHRVFCHRIFALAARLGKNTGLPMLALPTHAPWWVDPVIFVERVLAWQERGALPEPWDLCQGLLRLAPEGRETALACAEAVQSYIGVLVRVALGGMAPPSLPELPLLVPALRARQPDGELAILRGRAGADFPDGHLSASYRLVVPGDELPIEDRVPRDKQIGFHVEPDLRRGEVPLPCSVHDDAGVDCGSAAQHRAEVDVVFGIWPGQTDALMAKGVRELVASRDWSTKGRGSDFLALLLDPDFELRRNAQLLIAIALGCKDAGEHALAVDVATRAIGDGRLDGHMLGAALGELVPMAAFPCRRWATALTSIAGVSPLHAIAVHVTGQRMLRGDPSVQPRDLNGLLEAILANATWLGGAAIGDEEARAFLEAVAGRGKAAAAARKLLALDARFSAAVLDRARTIAAQARSERTRRYREDAEPAQQRVDSARS